MWLSASHMCTGKEAFLSTFEKILEGVDKTKAGVEQKLQQENTTRETLNSKYNTLLEKQRNYFKVSETSDVCSS